MPIPDLSKIQYQKVEDDGRNCPVCGAQVRKISDGFKTIVKCLNCGYSRKFEKDTLGGQHRYDLPVMLIGSIKTAWFELYQPIDEQLYNMLIDADWSPEEAANSVIKDLGLTGDEVRYFMDKLQFLEKAE